MLCVALADLELDIASLKLNGDPHFLSAGYVLCVPMSLCVGHVYLNLWRPGRVDGANRAVSQPVGLDPLGVK